MSLKTQGIQLLPLRPSIFAFTMDEHGFQLVCDIIAYCQTHYRMTLAEAVERINEHLGARNGYPPADVTADSLWFHETMEHFARVMIEGDYWVKKDNPT